MTIDTEKLRQTARALSSKHWNCLTSGGVDYILSVADAIDAQAAEIERLRTRLEINPKAPEIDGIYCRDETIKGQDELVDELRAKNKRLREVLRVACDHIDMSRLEISHCKDAALIRAALQGESHE